MKPDLYFTISLEDDDGSTIHQVWDCMTYDSHFQGMLEAAEAKCAELNKIFHDGDDPYYILKGTLVDQQEHPSNS